MQTMKVVDIGLCSAALNEDETHVSSCLMKRGWSEQGKSPLTWHCKKAPTCFDYPNGWCRQPRRKEDTDSDADWESPVSTCLADNLTQLKFPDANPSPMDCHFACLDQAALNTPQHTPHLGSGHSQPVATADMLLLLESMEELDLSGFRRRPEVRALGPRALYNLSIGALNCEEAESSHATQQ